MTIQEPVIVIEKLEKSYGKIRAVRGISMSVERGEIFGFLGPNGAGKTTTIRCMLDVIRPSAGTIRIQGLDAQRDKLALHQYIGYLPGDVRLPGQMTGKQVINYFSRLQGREPVLLKEQARGKTVFMSSHIMSDVEKVCHRVAVIRQGEIVTVEEVEALREKAGQRVIVEFGDVVPQEELARIPGVSMVSKVNRSYHFDVSGSMDPLIKALSPHEVVRLQAEEAPLEEVFFKFYEEPEKATTTK